MPTPIILDEIHLTFTAPRDRPDDALAPTLRAWRAQSFLQRIRRAVRAIIEAHSELAKVGLRVTR